MEEEEHIIVCFRQDGRLVKFSSKNGLCSKCGLKIYIALSTPVIENAKYVCMECVEWDRVTKISRPTEQQIADLKKHWGH
jgi:hypothetical protein